MLRSLCFSEFLESIKWLVSELRWFSLCMRVDKIWQNTQHRKATRKKEVAMKNFQTFDQKTVILFTFRYFDVYTFILGYFKIFVLTCTMLHRHGLPHSSSKLLGSWSCDRLYSRPVHLLDKPLGQKLHQVRKPDLHELECDSASQSLCIHKADRLGRNQCRAP